MDNLDDLNPETIMFDMKNFKRSGVSWFTRLLLRFWPRKGVVRLAREFGLNSGLMEEAESLFSRVKRVDLVPSRSGERGFQIILNRSTALYFYQDGDHFVYDGSEAGEYAGGDVTVLDDVA
jgi:hypothetical protein